MNKSNIELVLDKINKLKPLFVGEFIYQGYYLDYELIFVIESEQIISYFVGYIEERYNITEYNKVMFSTEEELLEYFKNIVDNYLD